MPPRSACRSLDKATVADICRLYVDYIMCLSRRHHENTFGSAISREASGVPICAIACSRSKDDDDEDENEDEDEDELSDLPPFDLAMIVNRFFGRTVSTTGNRYSLSLSLSLAPSLLVRGTLWKFEIYLGTAPKGSFYTPVRWLTDKFTVTDAS